MIHFLSDLHLSPDAPGVSRLFLSYLDGAARTATSIFILGDLFEAWPGDDALDDPRETFSREVAAALRAVSDSGTKLSIQHGNRDFLLGNAFALHTGAQLLPDPYLLSLTHGQFVLTHGDALCTVDTAYQDYRATVRAPDWQTDFLSKPLSERQAIAAAMRQQSEASKREKPMPSMDLTPEATDDFLRQHGYATMIHGHTHRPHRHDHIVDGIHVERWVLADWHTTRGEYLAWDGHRLVRHAIV